LIHPAEHGSRKGAAPPRGDPSERRGSVAELRTSEERLRLAKAAAGLGLHDFDIATHTIEWDERTRELWGVAEGQPITYELWLNGVHPEDRDAADDAVRRALDGNGDGDFFAEYRVVNRKDGVTRWVEATGRTAFENGEPIRLVGLVRDVTERKNAEEKLREAHRAKQAFLATLGHELRSPLAAIRSAADVLEDPRAQANPARVREMTRIIDRQVFRLARMTGDLLDLGRISRRKMKMVREPLDLVPLVREAMERSLPGFADKALKLSATLPDRPLMIEADPIRLEQALEALLHNAFKFSPQDGEVRVRVTMGQEEAVLRIADRGKGISADRLPHIFEMFAQGEEPPGRGSGGLGIGLFLARSVIELHGGTIEARSEGPDEGSEFTVRLPAVEEEIGSGRAPGEPSEDPGEPSLEPRPKAKQSDGRRIVVAEDHADSLHVLAMVLSMKGHEVETAMNGADALSKVREIRPDAVLLDIGMPVMDGYEVAREIRSQPWGKDLLLVAMTGWGQEKDKRRAYEAGFDTHLTKPVDLKVLQKVLQNGPPTT